MLLVLRRMKKGQSSSSSILTSRVPSRNAGKTTLKRRENSNLISVYRIVCYVSVPFYQAVKFWAIHYSEIIIHFNTVPVCANLLTWRCRFATFYSSFKYIFYFFANVVSHRPVMLTPLEADSRASWLSADYRASVPWHQQSSGTAAVAMCTRGAISRRWCQRLSYHRVHYTAFQFAIRID